VNTTAENHRMDIRLVPLNSTKKLPHQAAHLSTIYDYRKCLTRTLIHAITSQGLTDTVLVLMAQECDCDQGQSLHSEIHQLVHNLKLETQVCHNIMPLFLLIKGSGLKLFQPLR